MTSAVIVSGCPGSGKSTVCRALAEANPLGLHLVSDTFYEFIPHLINPATTQSRHQNAVVMQALAASVQAFVRGGYSVYLDGIVGPWFLPVFRPYLEPDTPTHYVVLQVSEIEAMARVRIRQGAGLSPTVTHMQRQFADLGPLARHGIDAGSPSEREVFATLTERLAAGDLILDWSLVGA